MLDSVAVENKLSTRRARILQVSALVALIAITTYNFISTCSPYFDTTYRAQDCSKTLIPAGTQLQYRRFVMTTTEQLEYDGFVAQNCSLGWVTIRMWFDSPAIPIIKPYIPVSCDNGVSLAVTDHTVRFWRQNWKMIQESAFNYRSFGAPPTPYTAMEYQDNAPAPDDNKKIWLGNSNRLPDSFPSTNQNVNRTVFETIMQQALADVHNSTLPGVRYLCNQCGPKADWTGQKGSLIWKLFYNTLNTIGSVVALIIIPLTLGVERQLSNLLSKEKVNPFVEPI